MSLPGSFLPGPIPRKSPGKLLRRSPLLPDRILSVTDLAQGFAVNADGELALSLSYGLSSSRLLFYENVFEH